MPCRASHCQRCVAMLEAARPYVNNNITAIGARAAHKAVAASFGVLLSVDDGNHTIRELHEITLKEGGDVNWKAVIDCEDRLPFAFGLMELADTHEEGWPLYRLILIDPVGKKILLTKVGCAETRVEQERIRAESEKNRADRLDAELKRLKDSL
jgi:hypothetical protein